jgi:hypothetical protein
MVRGIIETLKEMQGRVTLVFPLLTVEFPGTKRRIGWQRKRQAGEVEALGRELPPI